jgi:hypothetical protein
MTTYRRSESFIAFVHPDSLLIPFTSEVFRRLDFFTRRPRVRLGGILQCSLERGVAVLHADGNRQRLCSRVARKQIGEPRLQATPSVTSGAVGPKYTAECRMIHTMKAARSYGELPCLWLQGYPGAAAFSHRGCWL